MAASKDFSQNEKTIQGILTVIMIVLCFIPGFPRVVAALIFVYLAARHHGVRNVTIGRVVAAVVGVAFFFMLIISHDGKTTPAPATPIAQTASNEEKTPKADTPAFEIKPDPKEPGKLTLVLPGRQSQMNYLNSVKESIGDMAMATTREKMKFKSKDDILNAFYVDECATELYAQRNGYNLTPAEKKTVSAFKEKIIAFQTKIFPQMRLDYGRMAKDIAWAQDATVETLGDSHKTIRFTSALFALHGNILTFSNTVDDFLYKMRFRTEQYAWADGLGDIQSRTFNDPLSDRDIVTWTGNTPEKVK